MEQLSFFDQAGQSSGLPSELLAYIPNVFSPEEGNALLGSLINDTTWKQESVYLYGRMVKTPRLTAWYGDPGRTYEFSGTRLSPYPWTEELLTIKKRIEPLAGTTFNSVLLNYYRDANDSVDWHSDKETALGKRPLIASVSFGQTRKFDIRNKQDHALKYAIYLEHGSLLLMKGDLQQHWDHRIAKSTRPMKERVNLTFRNIVG